MPLSYPGHLGEFFKPGDVAQERWISKKPKRRGMDFCFSLFFFKMGRLLLVKIGILVFSVL